MNLAIWLLNQPNKHSLKKIDTFSEFILLLIVFLLPSQLGIHFWPDFAFINGIRIDYYAPVVYLTDILLSIYIGSRTLRRFTHFHKNEKYIIYLLTFVLLVNILFAISWQRTLIKAIKIILLILFSYFVSQQHLDYKKISQTLFLSLMFIFGISFFQLINNGSMNGVFYFFGERRFDINTIGISTFVFWGIDHIRAYSTFSHPNSFAGYFLVSALLFYYLDKRKTTRLVIALSTMVVMITTLSKNAIFASTLIIFLYRVIKPRKLLNCKNTIFYGWIISNFLMLLLPFGLLRNNELLTVVSRIDLLEKSIWIIKENLFFGVGLNNFIAFTTDNFVHFESYSLQPVHNVLWLIFSETGIIGFLTVTSFIYYLLSKTFNKNDTYLVLAIIAILTTFLLDHYWATLQQNMLLFSLVVGIILNRQDEY